MWSAGAHAGGALTLFIVPVWGGFIAIAFLLMWPFRSVHFYANWFAWAPAAIFFLLGFSIYRAAFQRFDRTKVSGLAELEPDRHRQQLITTGIRARVRHPIYLGHLCEIAGWCIGTGLVALYALAVFAVITGAVMIRMEDRELEARFGEAFRAYRQRVPGCAESSKIDPRKEGSVSIYTEHGVLTCESSRSARCQVRNDP